MQRYTRYSAHGFFDLENAPFDISQYSRLKFGSDIAARNMGHELANGYFNTHTAELVANDVVVFASPYNYVPNAATVMTKHFIDRLNELLMDACGRCVEYSVVHRKVSYTNDYGFLSKDQRKKLINNDSFYVNQDFLQGKLLVFVDDVCITGTHEEKLKDVLGREQLDNDAHFLYYAKYSGNTPDIEGRINFYAVDDLEDYVRLMEEPGHHIIIRPLKYLLSQQANDLTKFLSMISEDTIARIFHGCIAEGYFRIPSYQRNFGIIHAAHKSRQNQPA